MSPEAKTQNTAAQASSTPSSSVATQSGNSGAATERKQLDALHTEHGDTTIAETVVQKIAGLAAREVRGVHALGNAARRAFDNLAERIPGSQKNVSGGVSVEKGERQTAIDVNIIVEYGVSVVDVADNIRRNIITAVEQGTGLEVIEVNVNVSDVHLPSDDEDDDSQSNNDKNSERLQ